jgi:type IV pilus assembly protein PilN
MIHINLLPVRAVQKKERLVNQLAILILGVIATVLVCFFTWFSFSGRIDAVNADIKTKQTETKSLRAVLKELKGFEASQKDLRGKLDILEKLKANRSGPVRLLDELSKAVPKKIWIISFTENNGVISMVGGGMTEESIAGFMRDLENSDYYKNIELEVIDQKKTDGNDYLSFKIRCAVQTEEPSGLNKK